jgi:hypothetical protein
MQVLYFSHKTGSIQAPSEDLPQVPFWTKATCLPGRKFKLREKIIFVYDKYKIV